MNKSNKSTTTTTSKNPAVRVEKRAVIFNLLMDNIKRLEQLKDYYTRLKTKRDNLATAVKLMEKEGTKNPFESAEKSDFPFEIILNGKSNQYNNIDEIFKITHVTTVTKFSKALLKEVDEVLEALEVDLLAYSKKINQ